MEPDLADEEFLHAMPKVELHLHLEGAVALPALWELSQKYGTAKELGSFEGLKEKLRYRNFSHFIDTWIWLGQHLKEYDDYTLIATELARDLQRQNIRYAEVLYSPTRDSAKHLEPEKITEAVFRGLQAAGGDFCFNLIADTIRDNPPEEALRLVEILRGMGELRPVGIGIGGSEHLYPLEPFREVFAKARRYGLRTTAHAGEAGGADGIWSALKDLGVNRIGHGVRATEDAELMKYLKENQVPLELCVTSNLRTGVVKAAGEHPVKRFLDEGLKVTLNTDDPQMFHTCLRDEYRLVVETFGLSREAVRVLAVNALDAAWCSEEVRLRLKEEVDAFFSAH